MKWMTSLHPHESMVLSSTALVTRLFSTSISTACRAKHMDKLTLSNQHHSLKPVFITSLPLDCRDSQHRCFWSHETSVRPFSWRVAPRGQGAQPSVALGTPVHPLPVSVIPYLCLWAPLLEQHWRVSQNQQSPAQSTLPACWHDNLGAWSGLVPLQEHSWCLSARVWAGTYSPPSPRFLFAALLTRDSLAVFQPCQRCQWRGEGDTSLSGQCCAKLPPAPRDQHPWQTHQDVSCVAAAEHEPGKGWGDPWQRNSRGKSKAISVQTTTFPVLG